MKKIVILLIAMFITITNASALTIDSLGFTSDDINGIEFVTRDNKEQLYYMYTHDIYAMNENDDYIVYVRSVNNPFDKSFGLKTNITDEVIDLLENTTTNRYEYLNSKDFKWVKVKYVQQDFNITEYFLAWKDIFITVTFQSKKGEFNLKQDTSFDNFITSIKLTGDGKTEISHVAKDGIDYLKDKGKRDYTVLIIICIAVIGVTYYFNRVKGRKKN